MLRVTVMRSTAGSACASHLVCGDSVTGMGDGQLHVTGFTIADGVKKKFLSLVV